MTQQENCSNLDMLSIQKITAFVNDCVTFRQKTTFYATSSGLFSTRALVRPSGRISPAAVSAILVSVGPASSYTSTENSTTLRTMWPSESWAAVAAMPSATPACGSRVMPRYFWIASLQRARDQRKGQTDQHLLHIWLRENRTKPQAVPIPPYKKYSGCVRKERTKRGNAAQPEKTYIRPVYYPPRQKATGIWRPGKELRSGK